MSFEWTEAAVAELKRLWNATPRLTASEIGKVLGAGRCAVYGKAERLKLGKRPKGPIEGRPQPNNAKRKNAYTIVKQRGATAFERAEQSRAAAHRRVLIAGMALPTEALSTFGDDGCRFPMWPDDRRAGNLDGLVTCGREREAEHSYCAAHYRLAYYPPERRAAA